MSRLCCDWYPSRRSPLLWHRALMMSTGLLYLSKLLCTKDLPVLYSALTSSSVRLPALQSTHECQALTSRRRICPGQCTTSYSVCSTGSFGKLWCSAQHQIERRIPNGLCVLRLLLQTVTAICTGILNRLLMLLLTLRSCNEPALQAQTAISGGYFQAILQDNSLIWYSAVALYGCGLAAAVLYT
eukprot:GHRR01020049.1.p1 GENE.GHRR01020049.1~~GHRR01020049.1.p1  ORF type:complete len:185 (-),score=24.07 GHRR01020049.1:1168-1722(-)